MANGNPPVLASPWILAGGAGEGRLYGGQGGNGGGGDEAESNRGDKGDAVREEEEA